MQYVTLLLFCLLYAALNVSGAALIKSQLAVTPIRGFTDYIPLMINLKVITALFLIFLSALVLFKALSMTKFSLVIPIANGINFSLTILLGYLIFKDKVTLFHIGGFALILSGILLLSIAEKQNI